MTSGAGAPRAGWAAAGWPLAWFACALTAAFYLRTLSYGFYWDDFDVIRHWPARDVLAAWTGQYRPTPGAEFYRPLTTAYYSAIFAAFGRHAALLHVLPPVFIAVTAWLAGQVAWRDTASRPAAWLAAALVVIHPSMATSTGPWIGNQYHTLELIAALAAWLAWQRARAAAWSRWWLVIPPVVAAGWLTEDGILVGVALVAAEWLRAGRRAVPPRVVGGLVAVAVAMIAWRQMWLPQAFGYGVPDAGPMAANALRALRYVFAIEREAGAWNAAVTIAKGVTLAVVAWTIARRARTPEGRLAVSGVTFALVLNLPLAFVSSEGRWHMVALGAVFAIAGSAAAVLGAGASSDVGARRLAGPVVFGAAVVLLAVSSWIRIGAFATCAPDTRRHNAELLADPATTDDARAWISAQDATCAAK